MNCVLGSRGGAMGGGGGSTPWRHPCRGAPVSLARHEFVYHTRSDVRRRLKDNPRDSFIARRSTERALVRPVLLHVICAHCRSLMLLVDRTKSILTLDRSALPRRPFDRLTVSIGGSKRNSLAVQRGCSNIIAASSNTFKLCDPVTLTFHLLT